jgi:uncharacterized protein (TIGR00159 family)
MTLAFLHFSVADAVDILLVGLLIFQLYKLIRGTVAIKIFLGIVAIYLLWKLVSLLRFEMLGEILGQFIGVGVIALLIVFQQELRQFLVMIGNRQFLKNRSALLSRWLSNGANDQGERYKSVVAACMALAKQRTGALIVVAQNTDPEPFINGARPIDARLSKVLLEALFFKNAPLHDGAVLIKGNRIVSAGGALPISDNDAVLRGLGMRHRAALGLSEHTDAIVVVVSEERGHVSYAKAGQLSKNINEQQLQLALNGE